MNIKKTLITGMTIASILGASALPAFAANDKASLFSDPTGGMYSCPTGYNGLTTGIANGFININEQNGNLQVEVALKNATPNVTYDIYVNEDPGGCPTTPIAQLATNGQGDGNVHVTTPMLTGSANYWVSALNHASTTAPFDLFRSPAVQ